MPAKGGLSDKIGNRYEGRIAVWRLLQLLDEQHDSVLVRSEQPGDDHFEWWVQSADGSRTYTQVKRQQAPDREWTIGTLVSRGVLTAFGERLGQEPSARCEFLSTLSASHLQELAESAPMATGLRARMRWGPSHTQHAWSSCWAATTANPCSGRDRHSR